MSRHQGENSVADPVLRAVLEELRAEPQPVVDWEVLRSTIGKRAAPALAKRRSRRFVRLPRQMVPLALAAGIAFALWLGPDVIQDRLQPAGTEIATTWDEEEILLQALGDLTEQEFRLLVSGRAHPELLLAFAIGER